MLKEHEDTLTEIFRKELEEARLMRDMGEQACQSAVSAINLVKRFALSRETNTPPPGVIVCHPDGSFSLEGEMTSCLDAGKKWYFGSGSDYTPVVKAKLLAKTQPDFTEKESYLLDFADIFNGHDDPDCETITFTRYDFIQMIKHFIKK